MGEERFYRYLITYAIEKIANKQVDLITYQVSPEIQLLEYYDDFFQFYVREGDPQLLDMSKLFRRAAHKIYRMMLKKELIEKNPKFLNLV